MAKPAAAARPAACSCNFHSPFLYASHPRESGFMQDSRFYKGASRGMTMEAIQTQAMHRFEQKHGRSAGSIPGLNPELHSHAPRTRWAGSKA